MTKSATATRLGIDNTPDALVRYNLTALIENVLDPLREAWGAPIIVTSGYRCARLNKAVGGASSSQHTKGEAADIRTLSDSRADNMRLLRLLLKMGLPFDQLICEYPDAQGRPDWIHVSFSRKKNRGSKLTAVKAGSKTIYSQGIII
jgi:hypothetical protein